MLCTCKHCNKSFPSRTYTSTCENCKALDREIYEKIKDYLDKYPNSNAIRVAEGLGIKASLILKYVEDGDFVLKKGTFESIDSF
ncbi:MAG: hypothetical protein IJL07_11630 [Lachnospiraceae bacterium]|nr:hypothetical protein [Lachnospiraceae bacterium]MBQ6091901.1 hypothetical protein [Lachnospiraceae bacterium]